MDLWHILSAVIGLAAGAGVFFFIGIAYRRNVAEKEISSAEEEARRIINDAIKSAESQKREALVEAREEIYRNRSELEREIKQSRAEQQKSEQRLQKKEETLDRKRDEFEQREAQLAGKHKEADSIREEITLIKRSHLEMLEKISGYTAEEAKAYLISSIEDKARHEAALRLADIEVQLKEEADKRAREVISLAIQRCAAVHGGEATVSVVPLPSDEMKGRIIGREGRNIHALESLTGVDVIIDDTPEAVTLSAFDPIRREIARLTVERLVSDGRIHPARIEEAVERSKRDIEQTIKQEGERAILETGVHAVHPEIVKLLGTMKYRTSYGQNVLQHSIEVAHIAGLMAAELGADINLAKRAGLLHDLGKAVDFEMEGSHVQLGIDIAKKYRENNEVIHAIHAHHGDVEATTVIACLVQAADAVSAARPGARRENLENYIKRLEKLEEIANAYPGVDRSFAIQAGREIRIIVKPDQIGDNGMLLMASELAHKIESDMEYPGQIKVNIIREVRVSAYAK